MRHQRTSIFSATKTPERNDIQNFPPARSGALSGNMNISGWIRRHISAHTCRHFSLPRMMCRAKRDCFASVNFSATCRYSEMSQMTHLVGHARYFRIILCIEIFTNCPFRFLSNSFAVRSFMSHFCRISEMHAYSVAFDN